MRSAIVSVGTEILFGQIVNTNTVYLSRQLNELGIDVIYHETVGDNPGRAKAVFERLLSQVDLIIATGGLGPTQDDLTKEMAAEAMGVKLVPDQASMEKLRETFRRMGREMTRNNEKQAWLPGEKDGRMFPNEGGTAPGCVFEKDGKRLICLPGPPREMTRMFESHVKPYLENLQEAVIHSVVLRLFGIGESSLEDALLDLISNQTDPTLATYAKEGEVTLRITSKRKRAQEARKAVEDMEKQVAERVGEWIYSDRDESLAEVVCQKLVERGITVSCAESCTGGMFASRLIDYPGISAVFERGLVTYSNRAKMEELGVREETLLRFGAVSEETALEMTAGLKKKTASRLCISVTGVAGPGGGTKEKPVGLVYICADLDGWVVCRQYRMRVVSRSWNRNCTVLHMLNLINHMLEGRLPAQIK